MVLFYCIDIPHAYFRGFPSRGRGFFIDCGAVNGYLTSLFIPCFYKHQTHISAVLKCKYNNPLFNKVDI